MLETYGDEYELVRKAERDDKRAPCVWTVVDDGDDSNLISGFSYVNRLGYVLTEIPCPNHQFIIVL